MSLVETIQNDMKDAMKAHDMEKVSRIRMLISAIKKEQIDSGHEFNDEEVIEVLRKQQKQRKDSIEQFTKGGREDLAEKEQAELAIISTYVPSLMDKDSIEEVVTGIMDENGIKDVSQKGQLMGLVMKELKGKADGGDVSAVVNELLS